MDFPEGLDLIIIIQSVGCRAGSELFGEISWERGPMAQVSAGRLAGLLFGCLVVGVMVFMMVVILSNLISGE